MENTERLKSKKERKSSRKTGLYNVIETPFVMDLLDSTPNSIAIVDENRRIHYANHRFLEFAGEKKVGSIVGLHVGMALKCEIAIKYEKCGTNKECAFCASLASIAETFKTKKPATLESNLTVNRNNVIESYDFKVHSTPTVIKGVEYSIFTLENISHQKRRNILERVFFHDIINTIGGIMGFSELMKSSNNTNEILENSSYIFDYSEKLLTEIQNQKLLLEAENQVLNMKLERIPIRQMLEGLTKFVQKSSSIARDRNIIIKECSEDLKITSDLILLNHVLGNMIINALEAVKPGESVNISCTKVGAKIKFSVNNPGYIEPDVQMQIFRRSFSTKNENRGLGTYTMRLLSERYLKGKTYFRTSKDEGTTFYAEYSNKPSFHH